MNMWKLMGIEVEYKLHALFIIISMEIKWKYGNIGTDTKAI